MSPIREPHRSRHGALTALHFALSFLARSQMLRGELNAAALTIDEARLIGEATGNQALVNAPMILAALRGDEAAASELIQATSEEAIVHRWTSNNYARSVLYNGLGRHDAARDAAWEAFRPDPIGYGGLLVPELAEAASKTADRALLELSADWLSARTAVIRSGWAAGVDARVRAMLSEGEVADHMYRASIERLGGTGMRFELARTPICCTGSGCDANVAAATPERICAPRWRHSRARRPVRSLAVPSAS